MNIKAEEKETRTMGMYYAYDYTSYYREESCIDIHQPVELATGEFMAAGQVHLACVAGRTVALRSAGRVVVSGRTRTEGVRLVLDSGETLALTTGHRVLLGSERRRSGWRVDHLAAAGDLVVGDLLPTGRVTSVTQIDGMDAIRLFPERPAAYIHTPGGTLIGSRWHEISTAWMEVPTAAILDVARFFCETGYENEMMCWSLPAPPTRGVFLDHHTMRVGARYELDGVLGLVRKSLESRANYAQPLTPLQMVTRDVALTARIAGVPGWDDVHCEASEFVRRYTPSARAMRRAA